MSGVRSQLVSSPAGLAVVRIGPVFEGPGGRGQGLAVGTSGALPLTFVFDGLTTASVVLRDASDDALALEVAHRKYEPGTHVCVYSPIGHREWSAPWHLNDDATLSPIMMETKAVQRHVVLGYVKEAHFRRLCLVSPGSAEQLVWCVNAAVASMAPRVPREAEAIFAVASPDLKGLGPGKKALGVRGAVHIVTQHNGRYQHLEVGHIDEVRPCWGTLSVGFSGGCLVYKCAHSGSPSRGICSTLPPHPH
jgi:hypothetical protein